MSHFLRQTVTCQVFAFATQSSGRSNFFGNFFEAGEYPYGFVTQIFPSDNYRSERNGRNPPVSGFAVKVKS